MSRSRILLTCLLALTPALAARAAWAEEWRRSGEEAPVTGAPDVLETRWIAERPPGGAHDKIRLHRYRGPGPATSALLYLPGTNMNGVVAIADEDHNLWIYLARRGVDVYALDYRTHFVPSSKADGFEFMRDWGLGTFVEDARLAAELMRRKSRTPSVFVAGFSRGVSIAYAFAAVEPPGTVGGIIALDGGFKSHAPTGSFDYDAAAQKLDSSGRYASDVAGSLGWERRHELMRRAAADPSAAPLDPAFESIGGQVSDILYNAWRPGGLANPRDGVSRVEVLARLLDGYDRYYPAVQSIDGASIADHRDDPRTPIDDAWGELDVPVLYFGSTGMGPGFLLNGIYTAAEAGSPDVTIHVLEGYGHLDVLVGENSRRDVFEPVLRWIRKRVPESSD